MNSKCKSTTNLYVELVEFKNFLKIIYAKAILNISIRTKKILNFKRNILFLYLISFLIIRTNILLLKKINYASNILLKSKNNQDARIDQD